MKWIIEMPEGWKPDTEEGIGDCANCHKDWPCHSDTGYHAGCPLANAKPYEAKGEEGWGLRAAAEQIIRAFDYTSGVSIPYAVDGLRKALSIPPAPDRTEELVGKMKLWWDRRPLGNFEEGTGPDIDDLDKWGRVFQMMVADYDKGAK